MTAPIFYAGDEVSVKRRGDGIVLTVDARVPRGLHPYRVRLTKHPYETLWCAARSLTLIQRADESPTSPPLAVGAPVQVRFDGTVIAHELSHCPYLVRLENGEKMWVERDRLFQTEDHDTQRG